MDILVNVFGRVGMESLLLDVPFVCKPWYKASREPQCWEDLIFPEYIKPDDIWGEDSPDRGFSERLVTTYQENLSVTAFMRFIVNRSCGCATIIKLPKDCTEEALEYIANECPRLKALDVVFNNFSMEDIIPKLSKWKSLELMRLGKFHVGLFHMKSVLPQIGLHCNNFIWLSAPHASIEKDEASAIVASLPRLKYLDLHYSFFEKEALVMILQGCKKLVHLDVRKCFGFCDDDAEILELASHIPVFMCEGSGIIPEIGTSYLRDRRLDHELYCDQINHDDCVYDLFDYDDLFDVVVCVNDLLKILTVWSIMAVTGVAVNCYWNGRVKKESNDVVYEGAKVNVMPIKVFHGTTYAGLLDKIYATTAIARQNFELNIICRYPISSQEYKPIPIKNDEGGELLLEVPSRSGVYCVEIYLEEEPAPLRVLEATALLTKETNAVEVGDDGKNNGETSSKLSNDSPKIDDNKVLIGDRRKWEELNINCLVNVFQKVGMETLLLDVPLMCYYSYAALRCSEEGLEYAAKQCPALKVFGLHGYLSLKNASVIPKLIRNWKNLEVLRLRRAPHYVPEILIQISRHCKNFFQLMLPKSYVGANEASAIVTYLPKIKHLSLKGATIEKKNLVMILRCCRELVSPDKPFVERLAMEYGANLSITAFVKFIVNRSCGCATIIKFPSLCDKETLEYVANE
ncbi:hypothetical protein VitviT2T_029279 [Vitis vinifera]|uniref:F-box/LRR-repeat protein n=1 Tax=Vitis vinifera TaxID=29760 RepID=A0ABY9DWU6_VITVI|nr:hypothetical protein VitviT2T_029279 [Vitis vinifera]